MARAPHESPSPQVVIRTVAATHGKEWVLAAWLLFKQAPWPVLGSWVVVMVLTVTASAALPIIGTVCTPALFAGFASAVDRLRNGGRIDIADLLQGLQHRGIPLLILGVLLILTTGVIALLIAAIAAVMLSAMNQGHMTLILAATMVCVLIGLALAFVVVFAMTWAPCLVYFNHQSPTEALKSAILGMLKNMKACFIYSLLVLLLYLGVLLTAGIGILLVGPLLMVAMYTSYRDVFVDYKD
ncbi:MAG: BPSS1780 family membrane protein [Ketobacter sp.]